MLKACDALKETVVEDDGANGCQIIERTRLQLPSVRDLWTQLRVEKIISVAKPFVELLRIIDTDKIVLGKVYWLMSESIRLTIANERNVSCMNEEKL